MNRFCNIGLLVGISLLASCTMTGRNEGQRNVRKPYVEKHEAVKRENRIVEQSESHNELPVAHNTNNVIPATEIFKRYDSAVFMVFTTDGYNAYQGSGFFINADGLAVSNYHVFKGTGVGYEIIKLSETPI